MWVSAGKDVYSDAGSMCVCATKNICSVAWSMCVCAREYVSSVKRRMCVSAREDVSSVSGSMCVCARKDVSSIASSMCVSVIERYWPHPPHPPPKPPKMHLYCGFLPARHLLYTLSIISNSLVVGILFTCSHMTHVQLMSFPSHVQPLGVKVKWWIDLFVG